MNKIITIYELLGLIKDGNAPKKIHHQYYEYNWNGIDKDYQKNTGDTLLGNINIQHHLNDKVEIVEDKKEEIEKLKIKDNKVIGKWENGSDYHYTLSAPQVVIINKINEIIRYLKDKEEE